MLFATSTIVSLAQDFWKEAQGIPIQYPCDLQRAVACALPVNVLSLSNLSVKGVRDYLFQNNIKIQFSDDNQALHGFLMAHRGLGLVFINGTDEKQERHFTLAHEIAHFILDYFEPRRKAIKMLGESIIQVIDGQRQPTVQERLDSIFYTISVQPFQHLLSKTNSSYHFAAQVGKAEDLADAFAFELIAPYQIVIQDVKAFGKLSFKDTCLLTDEILIKKYGLPSLVVPPYSRFLSELITGGETFAEKLGFL